MRCFIIIWNIMFFTSINWFFLDILLLSLHLETPSLLIVLNELSGLAHWWNGKLAPVLLIVVFVVALERADFRCRSKNRSYVHTLFYFVIDLFTISYAHFRITKTYMVNSCFILPHSSVSLVFFLLIRYILHLIYKVQIRFGAIFIINGSFWI